MTAWDREVQRLVEHGRDREAAALAVRHLSGLTRQGASMDALQQLDQLVPVLGGVVAGIGPDQIDAPTPCREFTVRGVLEHMTLGATAFAAGFRGEAAPSAGDDGPGDPVARFGQAMAGLAEAMHAPGALDRTIVAPIGEVPGQAFARFVVLDGLVHGWDLATATGQAYLPPDELVAAVDAFARDAISPAMREAGMFAAAQEAPAAATPIEGLVAFTGRPVADRH
ncbi:MAG: TIGR03086 family metal-binding protein [Acidimicrobiia bacterium]